MPRGKDCEKKCVNYNKVPKKGASRKGVQEKMSLITMVLTWILLGRSFIYPESGHYVQ